jgi:hypothetical protein
VKYKQLLNTLAAVAVAAVGVRVVQSGGDWVAALDALATTVLTGLIKLLNPLDQDGGVVRPTP